MPVKTAASEISKMDKLGYQFRHKMENDDDFLQDLIVFVEYQKKDIAEAHFTDDGNSAYCQQVNIDENHQRKGIATAMYLYAETVLGRVLENFWDDDPEYQSPAARALWAQPNRPFGKG
ncbi:MAG: N-acetyltransferase [Desulfuromonadales bacterium]|nr:N-acetyltransferase [Desulfuromonadales bacterium]